MKYHYLTGIVISLASSLFAGYPASEFTDLKPDDPVQPGVWNLGLDKCKRYCDEHNVPLFAIWSRRDCSICNFVGAVFYTEEFCNFMKTGKFADVVYCYMSQDDEGVAGTIDQRNSPAYNWMRYGTATAGSSFVRYDWSWMGSIGDLPLTAFYWKGGKIDVHNEGSGFLGSYVSANRWADNLIALFERYFNDFNGALPAYGGGSFLVSGVTNDCLQIQDGRESRGLVVPLLRTNNCEVVYTNVLTVTGKGGLFNFSTNAVWRAGDSNLYVQVSLPDDLLVSEKMTLVLADDAGVGLQTNEVACVDVPVSASNPHWIGEYATTVALPFGEWTMDLDMATNKVRRTASDDACTLVLITGTLWCPHCKGLERQVLSSKGFRDFISENPHMALVTLDNPRRSAGTVAEDVTISEPNGKPPTLLRYDRGVANTATQRMASGAGYMSRHHVDVALAERTLRRNRDLGYRPVASGGFRPEKAARSPYPTVLLLNKRGQVVGHVPWKASGGMACEKPELITDPADGDTVSEMDVAATLRRFRDLVELNRRGVTVGPRVAEPIPTVAQGLLSAVNLQETWNLAGDVRRIRATVRANTGDGPFALTLQSGGYVLDYGTGRLASGLTVSAPVEGGRAVLSVEADASINDVFSAYSTGDTIRNYTLTACEVLDPGGDEEVRRVLRELIDALWMYVREGSLYQLRGEDKEKFATTDLTNCFAVVDAAEGLYSAKVTGDVSIPLAEAQGGEEYVEFGCALAKSAVFGFEEVMRTYSEDCGRAVFAVERKPDQDGEVSTGEITGFVEFLAEDSNMDRRRYQLDGKWKRGTLAEHGTTNLVWEFVLPEGKADARVEIDFKVFEDEVAFDSAQILIFGLRRTGSSKTAVHSGFGTFLAMIQENDEVRNGALAITRTVPEMSRVGRMAAFAGSEISVTVERRGGSSGLRSVLAVLDGGAWAVTNEWPLVWADNDTNAVRTANFTLPDRPGTAIVRLEPQIGVIDALPERATVKVDILAKDLPCATNDVSAVLVRNVRFAAEVGLAHGADFSVRLSSGSLPTGISGSLQGDTFVFAGVPAAVGSHLAVYDVYAAVGGREIRGGSFSVRLDVVDVAEASRRWELDLPRLEKAIVATDVPLAFENANSLFGVLDVTVPVSGRASAKIVSTNGVFSYSTDGWSGFGDGCLSATLHARTPDDAGVIEVTVRGEARADVKVRVGTATAEVRDICDSESGAGVQVSNCTYTVQMSLLEGSPRLGSSLAQGDAYLVLRPDTARKCVTYAGALPDGRTLSGSVVWRKRRDENRAIDFAAFPVMGFATGSSSYCCAGMLQIREAGAPVPAGKKYNLSNWRRVEDVSRRRILWRCGDLQSTFAAYGSVFDGRIAEGWRNRGGEDPGTGGYADGDEIFLGVSGPFPGEGILDRNLAEVSFDGDEVTLCGQVEPGVRLSYDKATGVVSGTFGLNGVPCTFKGVMMPGWSSLNKSGCSDCDEDYVYRHAMSGFYWYEDVLSGQRQKCGGVVWMDVPVKEEE